MDKKKASKAKQNIKKTESRLNKLIRKVYLYRKMLTPGKITLIQTKCGKSNCKCTRGEKHLSTLLYVCRGGPLKRIYVPKKDLTKVREDSERYRSFRTLRAEITRTFNELLLHLNTLEEALTEPYTKGARDEKNSRKKSGKA